MAESPQPQSEKLESSLDEFDSKPRPRRRLLRWALVIAAVAHIVIFVALFVLPNFRDTDETAENQGMNSERNGGSDEASDGDTPKRPESPISNDPKWKAPVEDLIEDAIKNHENLTQEQKQSELEDQLNKLERISNAENVAKITQHLGPLVNNQDRKTEPVKQPNKPSKDQPSFDHDTAQVHDVVKSEKNGKTIYIATMLDKEGRTLETELTAAEGESLHNTFQLIKKSPLLEKIYRGVVMGTLDKLLRPKSTPADKGAAVLKEEPEAVLKEEPEAILKEEPVPQ
ncbi:MAG: hypothetical protein ACI9HK_004572 [Pirellulaceae bacterium]|jgi:hypothetical protein